MLETSLRLTAIVAIALAITSCASVRCTVFDEEALSEVALWHLGFAYLPGETEEAIESSAHVRDTATLEAFRSRDTQFRDHLFSALKDKHGVQLLVDPDEADGTVALYPIRFLDSWGQCFKSLDVILGARDGATLARIRVQNGEGSDTVKDDSEFAEYAAKAIAEAIRTGTSTKTPRSTRRYPVAEDVWTAEGFSCPSARQDGLVIGGVARSSDEWTPYERDLYPDLFREKLQEGKDGLRARGAETLLLRLGAERRTQLMDEYLRDGTVSAETLAETAECGVADRYLLLARVTRDSVGHYLEADSPSEGHHVKATTRSVTVDADVFDLRAGATVWHARASYERCETVSYEKEERNVVDTVVRGVFGLGERKEKRPGYPDPPAMEELLRPLFVGLAKEVKRAQ